MKKIFKKISFSPSRAPKSEGPTRKSKGSSPSPGKQKREGYKEKMMRRHKLTEKQFDEAKKSAAQQEKDWALYKKEQVLKIFEPKNVYVSRSASSDDKHPKLARATKVQLKDGKTVDVEFGRMKEYYLYTLAPDKQFVDIKMQAKHEKELKPLRDRQKNKWGDKQVKSQAEYNQIKSLYEAPPTPGGTRVQNQTNQTNVEEEKTGPASAEEEETQAGERYDANTTDEKHGLFPEAWYNLSISRSLMAKKGLIYWIPKSGAGETEFEDDPEGKYTVTAERLVETIQSEQKLKDSGVVEPKKDSGKSSMTETLSSIHAKHQKTSTREIVYLNTLKGTIDFMGKSGPEKKSEQKTGNKSIFEEAPTTDGSNQITFAPTITAYVFKGKRMKRQYGGKRNAEKYVEERKDYTREAGEDTSGGL